MMPGLLPQGPGARQVSAVFRATAGEMRAAFCSTRLNEFPANESQLCALPARSEASLSPNAIKLEAGEGGGEWPHGMGTQRVRGAGQPRCGASWRVPTHSGLRGFLAG